MEQKKVRDGVHGLAAVTTNQAGHWVRCGAGLHRGGRGPEGSARSTAGGAAGDPAWSAMSLSYSPSPSLPVRDDTRGDDETDLKQAQLRLEYEKHETWYVSLLSTTAPPRQSMDSQGIGGSYERVPKDDRGQKQPSLAPGGMAPTPDRLVPLDLVRPIHRVRSMSDLQEALAQEARPAGGVAAQAGVFQATAVPRESPSWT
jgi:hypothetical protein